MVLIIHFDTWCDNTSNTLHIVKMVVFSIMFVGIVIFIILVSLF